MYMDQIKETINLGSRAAIALAGGVWATLSPTIPFAVICTAFIVLDSVTAWRLSRRVRIKHPGANDGKFKSRHFGKVIMTLLEVYMLVVLAHLLDVYVFDFLPISLSKMATGAVCLWQGWSILENKSSCNDAKWAKVLQYVMVDKAERHFDLPLKDAMERAGIDVDGDGKAVGADNNDNNKDE